MSLIDLVLKLCRALGNRGNALTRQGKLREALRSFNEAIQLCPWAVDPVLNRCSWCAGRQRLTGPCARNLHVDCCSSPGRLDACCVALHVSCRGVALEGMQRWDEAIADYKTVLAAAPNDPSGRCCRHVRALVGICSI